MKELVNNVETLFNVFVPGALCVWFYTKLSLKKIEYQGFSYRCCLYCNWYCMLRLVLQNQKLYSGKKVV